MRLVICRILPTTNYHHLGILEIAHHYYDLKFGVEYLENEHTFHLYAIHLNNIFWLEHVFAMNQIDLPIIPVTFSVRLELSFNCK